MSFYSIGGCISLHEVNIFLLILLFVDLRTLSNLLLCISVRVFTSAQEDAPKSGILRLYGNYNFCSISIIFVETLAELNVVHYCFRRNYHLKFSFIHWISCHTSPPPPPLSQLLGHMNSVCSLRIPCHTYAIKSHALYALYFIFILVPSVAWYLVCNLSHWTCSQSQSLSRWPFS